MKSFLSLSMRFIIIQKQEGGMKADREEDGALKVFGREFSRPKEFSKALEKIHKKRGDP